MNFEIRKVVPTDVYPITEVHVKTWQHAYKGQLPDEYLANLSIEKRADNWRKTLENPNSGITTFIAESQNNILGFCNVGPNTDVTLSKNVGELYAIYVDPDVQSQGIGSKLMSTGLEMLKTQGYIQATLWVLISNNKTREWYEKKGWKIEGKEKTEMRPNAELKETRYIIDL